MLVVLRRPILVRLGEHQAAPDICDRARDIVEAFTYNGRREKMRVIGKESLLEPLNRAALRLARKVADDKPGNLMASNISNTNIWHPKDRSAQAEVRILLPVWRGLS